MQQNQMIVAPVQAPPPAPKARGGYRESELGQCMAAFCTWMGLIIVRYPVHERHQLGAETRQTLWRALRAYSDSKFVKERAKITPLIQMDKELAYAKLLLREARDRKYIRDKKYREVFLRITEVGKLLGGMIRKYDPKRIY